MSDADGIGPGVKPVGPEVHAEIRWEGPNGDHGPGVREFGGVGDIEDVDDRAFVIFVTGVDVDPAALRTDLPALVDFLADHPELLERPGLSESAASFLGAAIIGKYPYARWERTPEREIAGPGVSLVIDWMTRDAIADRAAGRRLLGTLAEWPQRLRDEIELEALNEDEADLRIEPVVGFFMPGIGVPTFRDADGAVIYFGDRYPDGAPEEAYSRTTHTERFAPLHEVATAVIRFLTAHYAVEVEERMTERGRAVQLRPERGAWVKITFTDFPGLDLAAGAFFESHYPGCGCDACDEQVETLAEVFVDELFGIVGGGLRERYPVGRRAWTHVTLIAPDTKTIGGAEPEFTPDRADEVKAMLAPLAGGPWPAWPRKV